MSTPNKQLNNPPFSIFLGGPLYYLYLKTGLVTPPLGRLKHRIVIMTMFVWLPLLLLSLINGTAWNNVAVPFLFDIDIHTKLLGSITLLLVAEPVAHRLLQVIVNQFISHGIITTDTFSDYKRILATSMRLRNSWLAEFFIVLLVIFVGQTAWQELTALNITSWYATFSNQQPHLSTAGYWYVYVSVPIFQFLLLRCYYRILVWYYYLWKVSGLALHLNALHPDKAGGLGFLTNSIYVFAPIILAHTVLLSGLIANKIWHAHATLFDFKPEIIGFMTCLILLVITPLSFFIRHLGRTKRIGLDEYSAIASSYVNEFYNKWISPHTAKDNILGSSDIQSLADLSNSYEVSRQMRLFPFSWQDILGLIILSSIPLLPLFITIIPLEEMLGKIVGIIL